MKELRQIVRNRQGYHPRMNKAQMRALLRAEKIQSTDDPQYRVVPGNLPPELVYGTLGFLTPVQKKTVAAVSTSMKQVRDLYTLRDYFLLGLYEWVQKDSRSSLFPHRDRTIQMNFLHKNHVLTISLDRHGGSDPNLDVTISYDRQSVRATLPKDNVVPLLHFVARIFILFRGELHRSSTHLFKQYTPMMKTILERDPQFLQRILEPPEAARSHKAFNQIYRRVESAFQK